MDTPNAPHRILMQDENLQIQDLPDAAQNAIRRYNEKEKTYLSTKKRFENKGEGWDKKQEFEDALLELDEDATNKISKFLDQEGGGNTNSADEKKRLELSQRAKAVGLPEDATEPKIVEEENKRAAADKAAADKAEKERLAKEGAAADSKLPRNEAALKKLHDAGKTTVTFEDLKKANFNIGFLGPIGMNGCTCGAYRLYRDGQYDSEFQLSKLN